MTASAERIKGMRDRRSNGLRELRLVLPDARSPDVRHRVAQAVAYLAPDDERDALAWVETVSEFDARREGDDPISR